MTNIKYPWQKPFFCGNERKYLVSAFDSNWVSAGFYVDKFEKEFAKYNGSKYAITTPNCTIAIQLTLEALDIGHGDEVILPGLAFVAPANMVIKSGATPVYADVDPKTWCIDVDLVEKLITSKTKAILIVHPYGNVCEMDVLMDLTRRHGLYIIEDAAESSFSRYKQKYCGTFGDIACFSFGSAKTITTGEGGMVLTDNDNLNEKMRLIRNQGKSKTRRYWHEMLGHNFRFTNLQAAIGWGQLEKIDYILAERKRVYQGYIKYLSNEQGISLQYFNSNIEPVVWSVVVKIDSQNFGMTRDNIIDSLREFGIEAVPGFYPVSVMTAVYKAPKLLISENVGLNALGLPSYAALTDDDVLFICEKLKSLRR